MNSKAFLFFTFLFVVSFVIVGWYCLDIYQNKAPIAMTKGTEYFAEGNVPATQEYQDFFSWMQVKVSNVSSFIKASAVRVLK